MAVLIQEGINSESSGVMITADPYNREDKTPFSISAQARLGIKVVEGRGLPSRSSFACAPAPCRCFPFGRRQPADIDEQGGVKEFPSSGSALC